MWKALNHRKAVWMLPLQFQLNMAGVMECITKILRIAPGEVQQRETKTFLYEVIQLSLLIELISISTNLTPVWSFFLQSVLK
jgi:uncharacterized protein (DUF1499 family)